MAEGALWISFLFVFYVYFGYPVVLAACCRLGRKQIHKHHWEPTVSLVIAAYNERDTIEEKIINCLSADYPKDKLELIFSLDGPTDGTEIVARKYLNTGIHILYTPTHKGKAAALNQAMRAATGQFVVFTDARQSLDREAIRELIANLHDETVGAASGELLLLDETGKEASDCVGLYWRYEKSLRAMESRLHSMLGATGAIYAIRRELFRQLPEDTILDDVYTPMRIILAGKRVIFDSAARAYDRVSARPEIEYYRKVRTLMGNFQILALIPKLLLPWKNPVFFQFLSHKVGRLLVPYFLATLFISNLFLLQGSYLVLLSLQVLWYLLAYCGFVISKSRSKGSYPNLSPQAALAMRHDDFQQILPSANQTNRLTGC